VQAESVQAESAQVEWAQAESVQVESVRAGSAQAGSLQGCRAAVLVECSLLQGDHVADFGKGEGMQRTVPSREGASSVANKMGKKSGDVAV
jgi:hypothetical protein